MSGPSHHRGQRPRQVVHQMLEKWAQKVQLRLEAAPPADQAAVPEAAYSRRNEGLLASGEGAESHYSRVDRFPRSRKGCCRPQCFLEKISSCTSGVRATRTYERLQGGC